MKKSIFISLLALCMAFSFCLTGCGKDASDDQPYNYDLSKYIKPANYTGVELEKIEVNVDSDDIQEEILTRREAAKEVEKSTTGIVMSGDAINIDYVGTIDGVEFAGGNSQNKGVDIIIGKAGFIDGFEAGLVGKEVGSTTVLDLQFPENYHSAEVAGKACQFEVTIHTKDVAHIPDYNLEWVKSVSDCESLNEYEELVYDELIERNTAEAENQRNVELWKNLVEQSESLDYPEAELEEAKERYLNSITGTASQYGYTREYYIGIMGITQEKLDQEVEDYAKEVVKNEMLLYYIVREQGMTATDEEYQTAVDNICKDYGFNSEAEFEAQNNTTVEKAFGKKYILNDVYLEKVIDYIIENAKIQ